jgi:hypothetical protein
LICLGFAALGIIAVYGCYVAATTKYEYHAYYPHMELTGGEEDAYSILPTGDGVGDGQVAPLWVQLDDEIYFLPDLSEDAVARHCYRHSTASSGNDPEGRAKPLSIGDNGTAKYYSGDTGGSAVFRFRSAKLMAFEMYQRGGGVKFALSRQGPFQHAMRKRDDYYRTFGEPERTEATSYRVRLISPLLGQWMRRLRGVFSSLPQETLTASGDATRATAPLCVLRALAWGIPASTAHLLGLRKSAEPKLAPPTCAPDSGLQFKQKLGGTSAIPAPKKSPRFWIWPVVFKQVSRIR